MGQAQFPDGGDSEFVRGDVESAMAAVREMQRLGHYQSVKFFAAAPERLGTDPGNWVWARGAFFAMTERGLMVSFTYITALRSHVIKLRMSALPLGAPGARAFVHRAGSHGLKTRVTDEAESQK